MAEAFRLRWESINTGNDNSRVVSDNPSDLIVYRIDEVPATAENIK